MRIKILLGAALVAGAAGAPAVQAASYSGLYVFGDSLSDMGNVYDLTKAVVPVPGPPYFNGRFSNGPVYAEVLADRLGLNLDNSLDGGTDYAYGGAGTDFQVPQLPGFAPLSVEGQVVQFSTEMALSGDTVGDDDLFVVFAGVNNLQSAVDQPSMADAIVDDAVADVAGILGDLRDLGAQNFLVPNAPNLGAAPRYAGSGTLATDVSVRFNEGLATLAGPDVTVFDTFALLQSAIDDPSIFGLTNVVDPCFTGGQFGTGNDDEQCDNPDEYLFWDELHPTAAAHAALGDAMFAELMPATVQPVPIPGAILLFGSAIAATTLMFGRRGRTGRDS